MPTPFQWSLVCGSLLAAQGLFLLAGGRHAGAVLQALPRDVWTGRVLAVLAWLGAGWAIWIMPLNIIEPFKRFIPLVVLVCIPLSWYWLDDLLACRATGGILMLFPAPLLLSIRSHPSPWRLVLVTVAYLAIIKGMILMLYPWHMRRACHAAAASSLLRMIGGFVALVVGITILAAGLLALR